MCGQQKTEAVDWTLKNELLYDAITRAAKNLQIASANFEKNYGGEKSSDILQTIYLMQYANMKQRRMHLISNQSQII